MSPKCKEHKKGERQAVHMHYLPFGARLNKGILMVTQLTSGFSRHLFCSPFMCLYDEIAQCVSFLITSTFRLIAYIYSSLIFVGTK